MTDAATAERHLEALPLERIELDPDNVRSSYDPEHVESLRTALKDALQIGQEYINPPVVFAIGPERYRVKHGNCRVLAAQGVVDRLMVFVDPAPASAGIKVLDQLSENLLQGGLNGMDTARALRRLRDREDLSQGALVTVLQERGIQHGKFWIQMHLTLTDLHPDVQAAVAGSELNVRTAWELRGLAPASQAEWAERIVREGLSLRQVTEILHAGGDVEWKEAELRRRLGEQAESLSPEKRMPAPARQRHGAPQSRWELLPLATLPAETQLPALRKKRWFEEANESERQLALEAMVLGGYSAVRAIRLVQELQEQDGIVSATLPALNALRPLIENAPPTGAAARFLELRLEAALARLRQTHS